MENEIVVNKDNQKQELCPNYLLDDQEHINKVMQLY